MNKELKNLIFTNIIFICYSIFALRNLNFPIFLKGNYLLILFALIYFLLFLFLKKINFIFRSFFTKISYYSIFSSVIIALLLNVLFWSLGPSIIERSLSVNVLGTLNQYPSGLTIDQINWSLHNNYMNDKYQSIKRVNEQLKIGNIYLDKDDRYKLSKKGIKIIDFQLRLAKWYKINSRSVNPPNKVPEFLD